MMPQRFATKMQKDFLSSKDVIIASSVLICSLISHPKDLLLSNEPNHPICHKNAIQERGAVLDCSAVHDKKSDDTSVGAGEAEIAKER